jgi:hypothetical protein
MPKGTHHRILPLVSRASDAEFAKIGDYVDLDSFAKYFAVLVWIANVDSLQIGQNYYVYLHPTTNSSRSSHGIRTVRSGTSGIRRRRPPFTRHGPAPTRSEPHTSRGISTGLSGKDGRVL